MKKRKSFFALLVCVALLAVQVPAVLADDLVTLNIFGIDVTVPASDPVIPELARRLGIDLVLESTSGTSGAEAGLVARIAGGNIPDVFRVTNINSLSNYYQNDVLLNITDYFDQVPNLRDTFTDLEWARVSFDGNAYAIPRRAEENYNCWYIRYDWLDALGLEDPTTTDELLEVAKRINEADLDGNGKADTYAISGTYDSQYARSAFDGFYTAYGVTGPITMAIRDGQAKLTCTLPEFRLALEDIRRFVDAGVVDPEIVSNNGDAVIEKMATGKTGIAYGGWANYSKPAVEQSLVAVYPEAKWGPMRVELTTDYGVSGASKSAAGYDAVYCINADLVDQPEKLAAALKLFDYICTEEGDMLMSFGLEGVHYEIKDGTIVKLPAMDELTYGYGIQFTGRADMLYCMTKFANCAEYIEYCANDIPIYYHYGELVEQPDGINVADIKSYVLEQIVAFIFGTRSMDEYDDFLNTLYSVYQLGAYEEVATEQLAAIGYIE